MERKTRRGTVFSPFTAQIMPLRSPNFDFGSILANAVAMEATDQDLDDHDDADDLDDIEEDTTPPPADDTPLPVDPLEGIDLEYPPDPWNEVDDVRPAPPSPNPAPAKRPRTAYDDMLAGKQPLTGSHRRRKAKKTRQAQQKGQPASASTVRNVVDPAEPVHSTFDAKNLPSARGGYAGKVGETWGSKKCRSLAELLGMGFTLVRWNGYDARPLIDAEGRIFAVLAGQPRDPTYAAAVARAYDTITREGDAARFPYSMRHHRRGLFAAMNVGLSYGKGQTVPSWLGTGPYAAMVERLLADEDIKRMATFASAAFCLWAPRLYEYYREHKQALHAHFPHLGYVFGRSVFSCAAFNFGPNVWTFRHRDVLNVAFGWCAVQAGGPFDPTKGGHLVLWDLMLVIEFPPGALILLPSATINHSNVPVQDGDKRVSFTQFTAGGLIRFVDNGFRTEDALKAEDPAEYERICALKDTRFEMGLGLFSTMDELLAEVDIADNVDTA
ncbi:hypothetical protein C8R43DRAFT_1138530 [Mycena crocata]|nr:hypothetical protein C8R43DRAFT_1138530 [Mycena crocata]